jgi:hypothetical protein
MFRGASRLQRKEWSCRRWNKLYEPRVSLPSKLLEEADMGLGRGALLWLIGIPLPGIILLALFWHH